MTYLIIEYTFDGSWHPLCLRDSQKFPRKYTFEITPKTLSRCHEFTVEFATFAGGPRSYDIKIRLNGSDQTITFKSMDVVSVTISHYHTKKCHDTKKAFENGMMWQKKINEYEKEIRDLEANRSSRATLGQITEQCDETPSDLNDDIDEKIKGLKKEIDSIKTAIHRTQHDEILDINSITLPYNTQGKLTNFAQDSDGTFWWYVCDKNLVNKKRLREHDD
jgi:arsenate reductase-like glutaredoxin family protein